MIDGALKDHSTATNPRPADTRRLRRALRSGNGPGTDKTRGTDKGDDVKASRSKMKICVSSGRRNLMLSALAALVGTMASMSALAQTSNYPNKPIRIIVPFAVGGIADTFGRVIGIKLTEAWGQPVIVENKTGAGGNIGAELVAKSPPDGYTLVIGNNGTHAVNVSLFKTIPFDPIKDFVPVAHIMEAEGLLVVNPSVKANSVREIIEMARAQPGKLSYASGGLGTTSHLAGAFSSPPRRSTSSMCRTKVTRRLSPTC